MSDNRDFSQESYQKHEEHFCEYAKGGAKAEHAQTWFDKETVDAWRHERMYEGLKPLFKAFPEAKWVTVGDGRYGGDAHYIGEHGIDVLATDISDVLLKEGKEMGYIEDFSKENAECLSFADNQFDFAFCKESYHHFPRPMIALYEMLRVARKGVVLIEPNDPFIHATVLEALFRTCVDLVRRMLGNKVEKHSFEESGNYVFSISKREMEKVALGLNLRLVAFKGINDCFIDGVQNEKKTENCPLYQQVRKVIARSDFFTKLKLKKSDLMTAVIFKDATGLELGTLAQAGYEIVQLPENPHV